MAFVLNVIKWLLWTVETRTLYKVLGSVLILTHTDTHKIFEHSRWRHDIISKSYILHRVCHHNYNILYALLQGVSEVTIDNEHIKLC